MPYTNDHYLILVEGDTGGLDSFVNTWAVEDVGAVQDPQDAVDIIHAFYDGINDEQSAAYQALSASIVHLIDGTKTEADWAAVVGGDASPVLPTQIAVRLSLRGALNVNGGPFLPGWSNAANDGGGILTATAQADIETAFTALRDAMTAADWRLCINRPTVEDLAPVFQAKVGRRFDVIRRRANEQPEQYAVINWP